MAWAEEWADGVMVSRVEVPDESTPGDPAPILAALAAIDPDEARKAVAAGALLVSKAGELWDALTSVAESNTAKPLLDKIVDVALTVALSEDPNP